LQEGRATLGAAQAAALLAGARPRREGKFRSRPRAINTNPSHVLLGKFKKDVSFALRRGTIAQVTTALDAGQRAAEDELALNMAGWDR
jgi:hypothetical protein